MPRSLANDTPDQIERTLWFTEGALEADPITKDLAPRVVGWYPDLAAAADALKQALRAQIKAQAAAVLRDSELDDGVEEFADDLYKAVGKDRKHSRYSRYLKIPLSRFKRIDRLTEATTVEGWKDSIAKEPEDEVSAHAEPLAAMATASREATQAANAAEGERTGVRARSWDTYVAKLDHLREALHSDLVKRGQKHSKPRGWADRFFEVESRSAPAVAPATAVAPVAENAPVAEAAAPSK